ncbi:MAG: FAD-binding oxidoreductase [Flavobacteriales bacterium]|nr:FAD-binding oxidoreductase [Flavobacteriales bacterium]
MTKSTIYDHIVIGKGLVGASAAKHLAGSGQNVALIGPSEPQNDQWTVYGSHYDQGRIQRIIGKDRVWTKLNLDSVKEYPKISMESGIQFHKANGCLYVCPYGEDEYLKNARVIARHHNLKYTYLRANENSLRTYKGFSFPLNSEGILESEPCGTINPRLLLKAQLELFNKRDGTLIEDTVVETRIKDDSIRLVTEKGEEYMANKVLVATGSFLNSLDILPQKVTLQTKGEVIVLIPVDPAEVNQFSGMPCLLYELDEDEIDGIYLIPPVQYPDGNFYLKIGSNHIGDVYFKDPASVRDWFLKADVSEHKAKLLKALKILLPELTTEKSVTKKCIISRTLHGRPYIGETDQKGLYLAGGCNGYSAMCSESIGRLGAELMLKGTLPEGYERKDFKIHFQ